MDDIERETERFWDSLLSRQPDLVREAFADLDAETQQAVVAHLRRMTSEEGWHPEQVLSAEAALSAIFLS
jgi:hypothetical protein